MISRACPVCGSTNETVIFAQARIEPAKLDEYAFASRKLPEYMHYRLINCPACDLLYASPIPGLAEVAQAYHEAAFDSAEEAGYASRTYGRVLSSFMPDLADRKGALDIGTGDGAFLEELLNRGFSEVSGVEPSLAPIQVAKPHIKPLIKHTLFDPQDFETGSLSLLTCFQTLEHLYDPAWMCREAYNLLKPGGAVFFICHNRRAWSARLLRTKSPIFDIEHLQLFSPPSLRYMLEQTGFQDITIKGVYNRYPLHYWVKLFPFPANLKRSLIKWLKKLRVGYLPIALPAGNLAVIGYKKKSDSDAVG